MTTSRLCLLGLVAAVSGAANAALCYAQLPVPVAGDAHFAWHLIPAGALHGGLLAVIAVGMEGVLARHGPRAQLVLAPAVAWAAGVTSWIPLNRSAFDEPWAKSLTWPFHETWTHALFAPFQSFGLVAGLYYAFLALLSTRPRSAGWYLAGATASGALGSLWWWISVEPWYFSLLHGAIWGSLVGTATWSLTRNRAGMEPGVA